MLCHVISGGLAKDSIEQCDQLIDIVRANGQWGFDLEDVVVWSIGADQDALFAHAVNNIVRQWRILCAAIAIGDRIDPDKQADTAHIANRWVLVLKASQAAQ